jgi:uncharacterized protein YigA (DUF484 family)
MTSTNIQTPTAEVMAEEQVAEYLVRNPDFFSRHPDLLESITIPHPCGDAVSLIARQISVLRDRNHTLQQQLQGIVQIARENDALFNRIHQLILTLMDTATLEHALANLEWALHEYFQADYVATRILTSCQDRIAHAVRDLFVDSGLPEVSRLQRWIDSEQPECGRPKRAQAEFLFGDNARHIGSCVLIPLRHSELNGLLAIGSRSKERYDSTMGQAFLARMGEIIAARLAVFLPRGQHAHAG